MTDRETYPRPLIILHWLIVALIVAQWLSSEGMEDFFRSAKDSGVAPGFPRPSLAMVHAGIGATILVLAISRLFIRMKSDIPPPPKDLHPILQFISRFTHYGLYAMLILLPLSGVASLLINPEAGDVHELLVNVLYALAAAHILGALTHLLILRDGVFWRILPVKNR
jgi:cytochrome b561